MNLAKINGKVKSTTQLSLSAITTANDPAERVERRLKALIANSDWLYDTLNLLEKVYNNETELNNLDMWAAERLDLTIKTENGRLILVDRYHEYFDTEMLNTLKNKIINLTTNYAARLIREPELHHMEKLFKKALKKAGWKKLNAEEINVLKEAYLKVEDGRIVNLKNQTINLPRFNFLKFLIS